MPITDADNCLGELHACTLHSSSALMQLTQLQTRSPTMFDIVQHKILLEKCISQRLNAKVAFRGGNRRRILWPTARRSRSRSWRGVVRMLDREYMVSRSLNNSKNWRGSHKKSITIITAMTHPLLKFNPFSAVHTPEKDTFVFLHSSILIWTELSDT